MAFIIPDNASHLTKKMREKIDEIIMSVCLDPSLLTLGAKIYIIRNNLDSIPTCASCKKQLVYHKPSCSYRTFCSAKCSSNSVSTQSKKRNTNFNKYGSSNVLTSPAVQMETKRKNLEKYGVENYCSSEEYKKRISNGDIKRKPIDPVVHRRGCLDRVYEVTLAQFNDKVLPLFLPEEFDGGGPGKHYKWECTRCSSVFTNYYNRQKGTWPKCPTCDAAYSDLEYVVINFLRQHNVEFKIRDRAILSGLELDIVIPSHNLAIELNGLYFHCDKKITDTQYHSNKTELCRQKGIKLIHIFADEIYHKRNICLNRLRNNLGLSRKLYARKCTLRYIDKCAKFLNKYHIQGSDRSNIKIGAFYKNKLVGVMTFTEPRLALGYKKQKMENIWELSRFCTIGGFTCVGLFEKMLTKFKNEQKWNKIISYADARWSAVASASVYSKCGFNYVHLTSPNYWYTKNFTERLHRFAFRKSVLVRRYPHLSHLTEREIMKELGYSRIWDCGNHKFELDCIRNADIIKSK